MLSSKKALVFGFLIWAITFAVALAIFPIRESNRPLFESIMPVVLAVAAVVLGLRYFRGVEGRYVREGVLLGGLWFLVNVVIDLPLMLSGPMAMSPADYAGDIGLTYLILPIITFGIGSARAMAGPGPSGRTAVPGEIP